MTSKKSTIVRVVNWLAQPLSILSPCLAARLLEQLFLTPRRWRRPHREACWLGGANRSVIAFDEERVFPLFSWGEGPTVLLAHGWSGRGSQMAAFAQPLVQAGYRVVAFDAPGHGEADGRLTGVPEMARAIQKVADEVGPIHAVVAHSLGTAATSIALSGGLRVDRLVYIAPPENPGGFLWRVAHFLGFSEEVARRTADRIQRRFSFSLEQARGATLAPAMEVDLLVIHDLDDQEVAYQEGADLVDAWPGAVLVTHT